MRTSITCSSLCACLLVFAACGGGAEEGGSTGEGEASSSESSASGDGDSDTSSGDGDGDPASGDGDGDGGSGDGDGDGGSGDGDGDGGSGDGDGDSGDGDGDAGDGDGDPGDGDGDPGDGDGDPPPLNELWASSHLWYSIDDKLIYIEIDPSDGSVVELVVSPIEVEPALLQGQSGITMLLDEQFEIDLLLTRINGNSSSTQLHRIHDPPTDGSPVQAELLGTIPDGLLIEALYTDCQGLVYLMDTGADVSSSVGNRLIRFTGDYLGGDLGYEVITDLQNASVADIDDMGPGIDDMGEISDGQGYAIDSASVYDFDYNSGTGQLLGSAGTYGIHALGGPLFDDDVARLYVLDIDGNLYGADPDSLALSPILITGPPAVGNGVAGWSGLTGPLTECESTLPDPQ